MQYGMPLKHISILIVGLFISLTFVISLYVPLEAAELVESYPPDRPTSPTRPTIPSRPILPISPSPGITLQPLNSQNQSDKAKSYILLYLEASSHELWTEVEWVDANGLWHVVAGWRGYSTKMIVKWTVEKKDLGKGFFRWHVYDQEHGISLGVSDQFILPKTQPELIPLNFKLSTSQLRLPEKKMRP